MDWMENFHSWHLTSERDPLSKILHVKTFKTMDNVHIKLNLLQHATMPWFFTIKFYDWYDGNQTGVAYLGVM